MINEFLFDYPNYLNDIFDKLNFYNIKTIIVGGYVRDKLLNKDAKDIDIELYGIDSYEKVQKILEEFGSVNLVGKSFGVCKLSLNGVEIDFTFPRHDNKIASGHKGFAIQIDKNLDFTTAASRRDFTINSIGYDTQNKNLLDPFNGIHDLNHKIIRAVNLDRFGEDPLRVLRAVGFSSRFHFHIEKNLFNLCKNISKQNLLGELPKERIFVELKKILLKSAKPSIGVKLLKELNTLQHFKPLDSLSHNDFVFILGALDKFAQHKTTNDKTNILIMLSILCYKFTDSQTKEFITNITNEKSVLEEVVKLLQPSFISKYDDSKLYKLATQVNIEKFLLFHLSISNVDNNSIFKNIKKRAKELNIFNNPIKPFLRGKDLLELELKPSKEFSKILSQAYEAQMNLEIHSRDEAISWLHKYIKEHNTHS